MNFNKPLKSMQILDFFISLEPIFGYPLSFRRLTTSPELLTSAMLPLGARHFFLVGGEGGPGTELSTLFRAALIPHTSVCQRLLIVLQIQD